MLTLVGLLLTAKAVENALERTELLREQAARLELLASNQEKDTFGKLVMLDCYHLSTMGVMPFKCHSMQTQVQRKAGQAWVLAACIEVMAVY